MNEHNTQAGIPLELIAEYDAAAEWCAERGLGKIGDRLPELLSRECFEAINADTDAFQIRVAEMGWWVAVKNTRQT